MKRTIQTILVVGVLTAAAFAIRNLHQSFGSWWLDAYGVLFVTLPLAGIVYNLGEGKHGFKQAVRTLTSVTAGILILSLMYQFVTKNWWLACLAGAIIPGVYTSMREYKVAQAQAALNQGVTALNKRNYKTALKLAQEARTVFIDRGRREAQASAERVIGIAYMKLDQPVRAVRYLNTAAALFKAAGKKDEARKAESDLSVLQRQGVDISTSAVSVEDIEGQTSAVDWSFVLNGILSVIFLLAAVQLWGYEPLLASIPVMGAYGFLALLFIYSNYVVIVQSYKMDNRIPVGRLVVLNGLALIMLVGFSIWMLNAGTFQVSDYPPILRSSLRGMLSGLDVLPAWSASVITAISFLLLITLVLLTSGRTPTGIFGTLFQGDVNSKAYDLASGFIDTKDWNQALTQLYRIDLSRVKEIDRKKAIQFYFAYAHYMAEHPKETRQYVKDLLELDRNYKAGLYLAGYIELKDDKLLEAESHWRQLYKLDPKYRPGIGREQDKDAAYYLCLTLYRKAMNVMEKDFEQGAEYLAEIGRIGALDQEVSDALIRVHLYRTVQLIHQRSWKNAAQEAELANHKLVHLRHLVEDDDQVHKLSGFCTAASGLVAYRQSNYPVAKKGFQAANEHVRDLTQQRALFTGKSRSLLEELLRAAMEKRQSEDRIHPAFRRDLQFLSALVQIHELRDELVHATSRDWRSKLAIIEAALEDSLGAHPNFMEARALLGLIYYYAEEGDKREKGMEMLQSVRERVGSSFIAETVKQFEVEQQRQEDAQKAYFNLLQQYMQFANIPIEQRQALRGQVLDNMRLSGKYESFVSTGGLEIDEDREREPSVQEYVERAALLQEKLRQLQQLKKSGELPEETSQKINSLMGRLEDHNQELQNQVQSIVELEQQLLLEAQQYL